MDVVIVAYLISNILNTLAVERGLSVFFKPKKSPFLYFSYIAYFIMTSFVYIVFTIPILNLLTNILLIILITFNYDATIIKKITAVIAFYIIMIIGDLLSVGFLYYYPDTLFGNVEFVSVASFMLTGFTIYLFSLILCAFKNIKTNKIKSRLFWFTILFMPLSSLYIIILILSSNLSQFLVMSSIVIIAGLNILIFYLHDALSLAHEEKLKSLLAAQENEYYHRHYQTTQDSIEKMNIIRHDIKMHLNTVNEYSDKNELDNLKKYVKNILGDVNKSEMLCDTGILAIDSIVNYKLSDIKNDNIDVELIIKLPTSDLNIEDIDITAILGNLIDNREFDTC